jgi:tRNA pseudouridine38-40 synthase
MARYRFDCSYHGRRFHGWQRQVGLRTVQGELETWLGRLLRAPEPVSVVGAGRTDAGVHAEQMVAHFDWDSELSTGELQTRLAAALPDDLVVQRVSRIDDDFHARYSAIERSYIYRLSAEQSPFERDRVWHVAHRPNLEILSTAAAVVSGEHDFAGFCRAESRKEDNTCRVTVSDWRQDGSIICYRVSANRFLHEMVRLLVGTFVAISTGRFPVSRVQEILASGDVRLCGDASPAHGLTLASIRYGGDDTARGDFG